MTKTTVPGPRPRATHTTQERHLALGRQSVFLRRGAALTGSALLAVTMLASSGPLPAVHSPSHAAVTHERDLQSISRSLADRPVLTALTVTNGSDTAVYHTQASTVRAAFMENELWLTEGQVLDVDLNMKLDGTPVTVNVLTPVVTHETESTTIPFTAREIPDTDRLEGTREVVQAGVNGEEITVYQVTTLGDAVIDRTPAVVHTQEPVEEIISVGTKTPPPPPAAPTTHSVDGARAVGQQMAANAGWTGDEWTCLDRLWERESNWRVTADNPSSSAYGIPQALPGSKMASAGPDWQTNAATQIAWGLGYIRDRYGSPCGAWRHSASHGWY